MGFKVLPDGAIQTDTLKEALKVRDAILGRKPRDRRATRATVTDESDDQVLSPATKAFLRALVKNPAGLTSRQAAEKAGLQIGSLPPIVRGLNAFARSHDLVLGKLLVRDRKFHKGRPVSTYRLSAEGCELFQKQIASAQAENDPTIVRIAKRGSEPEQEESEG